MESITGSKSFCAASGSRPAKSSIDPLISAKRTVALDADPSARDLAGQVLRRVTPRRGEAGLVHNRLYGIAALGAELRRCWHRASTPGASSRQLGCTLVAELRLDSVFVAAPWTLHWE